MTASVAPNENGAIAVLVAIVLVVLMAMAAFALDTGNGWQERRHLITGTDAAALGAAQDYAQGANGCSGAPSTLNANEPAASMTSCAYTPVAQGSGYVTVQAKSHVDFTFARVIGFDGTDVHSSTTAAFGLPSGLYGLRPLGLCWSANPPSDAYLAYQDWAAKGMPNPSDPVTITYGKNTPLDCGANVPGNWGVLDFNGGANSNSDTKDWIENGYPKEVTAPSTIPGDTGAFSNSLSSALDTLVSSQQSFALPLYSSAAGNGSNAAFQIVGFIGVKLVSYVDTGPAATRSLTLRFVQDVFQGTCCSHGPDLGVRVVFICAVDPSFDASDCADR